MEIAKKFINVILIFLTIIFILLNSYIFYVKVIKKQNLVKVFGYSALIVISGSMAPELYVDDLIIIKEDSYKENDIITFQSENSLVTHRIIKIEDNKFYTKGDSNNVDDDPVSLSQIQGKVVYKISYVGKIVNFISSPIGITIFIAILFLLLTASKKQKKDEENYERKARKH